MEKNSSEQAAAREHRRKRRRSRRADWIAAVIVLGLLVYGGFTLKEYISYRLLLFAHAEQGEIERSIPAEMVVIRKEYLVLAPAAGEFRAAVAEGERVKEGARIGSMEQNGQAASAVYAPKSGVVSFHLDSYEEVLTATKLSEIDWPYFLQLCREDYISAQQTPEEGEEAVEVAAIPNLAAGRTVAKVIDNLVDYQVFVSCDDNLEHYLEAGRVSFRIPDEEGRTISGRIAESGVLRDGSQYLLLTVASREEVLLALRYTPVDLFNGTVRGISIPESAVFINEEGQSGVYCKRKRQLIFQEVEVLASISGQAVVEGLKITDIVVSNPEKAKAGQKVY